MTHHQHNGLRIRPLEADDRSALDRMYAAFSPRRAAHGLPPEEPHRLRHWLDDVIRRGQHLIAETAGGDIVGHVLLVPLNHDTTELAIFVDRAHRGRGLGTALNIAALELARQTGWKRVWLCVDPANRAAIRSYRKAGFVATPGTEWAAEIEMIRDFDPDAAALSAIGRPTA